MGLDMYLNKYRKTKLENGTILREEIDEVYWRKFNAVHKWFVDNVQDGIDDCERYSVSEEQLKELLSIVSLILNIKSVDDTEGYNLASELLPTQEGFFFGTTHINEDYWDYLEYTKEQLEGILSDENNLKHEDCFYTYRASW